ncbi:DUF4978 domain-containing protein [Streptomyces sp. TRM68367]|uniref:DUF4978 domain-containing protein n=1 Tax=Streptomyces sp. TRM68367 TaxID=2758415 RepID=UPI00165CB0E8|nr:DUF4978 domain-containing protein [Streptomyces sp. TRM68367]MBC9728775.1 DUF4978 domain-containing protein [Streptomyces sp. TRM68367]
MKSNSNLWSRRRFLATTGSAALGGVALDLAGNLPQAAAADVVSYVDTSKSTYDKLVLMVDGKPLYHSGIQFRYEKHKYTFGWTDAQLKPVLQMIRDDGFTVVNIPIWWSQVETSKDTFSWTDIDRYLAWCKEYGLKLELLWFGCDSTGFSLAPRFPPYVLNDYQLVLKSDGTKLALNGTNLLDKTDPNLLSREKYVLGRLMAHIALADTSHTLIGVQVLNEPNVAQMQWGQSSDRSYSSYSTDRWNSGGYTDAAKFRNDVLLDYLNQLGQVVKQSNHSVYTRVNVVGDARPITENEALRNQGKTFIDFFGRDPYTQSNDVLYHYGTDGFWAQGKNFPMIMENFAGTPAADVQKFNAIAGNTAFNLYAALDPDSSTGSSNHGLYNFNPTTKVVTRKAVSDKVAALNHVLNKISRDLASKSPVEAGGTNLQTFNRNATAGVTTTKPVGGVNITYTTSSGGQAFGVRRGAAEFAFTGTGQATFTLPGTVGVVRSVETGHYDGNDNWVRAAAKTYSTVSGDIAIDLAAGECVRVTYLVSGATYKMRHSSSGLYLDTDLNGAVTLVSKTVYDDQDWIVAKDSSGSWTIKNARPGRNYLETVSSNNGVIWNSGAVSDSSLWSLEGVAGGGFRVKNNSAGRAYLYRNPAGEVKWNSGTQDSSTVWVFEPK